MNFGSAKGAKKLNWAHFLLFIVTPFVFPTDLAKVIAGPKS